MKDPLELLPSCAVAGLLLLATPADATIVVDGQRLQVVDMHLHPGRFGTMNPSGKAFILGAVPPFLRAHAPAILGASLDPYAKHVGIKAETERAGVDHAVLYAVYTHHTTGYYSNEELLGALDESMNAGWAWGFASINFDDTNEDPALLDARILAMRSYLELRPDVFIGIKLAHAHQGNTLDDESSFRVYELAGELGVPVLLHTGFSPFPNTQDDPAYYDPAYLLDIVTLFDGTNGPRVDFVLSHVGQGDARSVEASLSLAEASDNVWLEVSALGRPLTIDEQGQPIESTDDQYPYVLEQVRARGLVDHTLYASDGAQLSGFVGSYLQEIVDGMLMAGFSTADVSAVLAENFFALYERAAPR